MNKDEGNMICNECETVAHCTKHGCVPKQPAPVQPVDLAAAKLVFLPTDHPADKTPIEQQKAFVLGWNGALELLVKQGPLYTTPPAAAVPDAIHHTDLSEHPEYISGWNDYRQAMLEMMK